MALLSEADALKTVANEVPYWEIPSYGETFAPENTGATRRLFCYWKDRKRFMLDVLGDAVISGTAGTAGATINRILPERHPDFDSSTDFFAMYAADAQLVMHAGWASKDDATGFMRVNDSPISGDGTGLTRVANGEGLAVYDVHYAPTLYEVLSDAAAAASGEGELSRWVVPQDEPGGENLPLPKGLLEFAPVPPATVPEPAPELAPQLFPTVILGRQWLMVPLEGYREDTILGYTDGDGNFVQGAVGALNDATFLGRARGTLLGLPPVVRRYMHANTQIYLDILFRWQYRPMGHNYFLRNDGSWALLRRKSDNDNGPFLTFDMTKVFDVSAA